MRRPAMETTIDVPPPPYSETDSSPSSIILTPATSVGDHSSVSGSGHLGAIDDDHPLTPPSSAEAYFESRSVRTPPTGPPSIHSIRISSRTGPQDLPYPEPAQVFLSKDLTHQDWLTFVNHVLPDHPSSVKNDDADVEAKEESVDERMSRLALGPDANSRTGSRSARNRPDPLRQPSALPFTPEILSAIEATIRFWNEGFFLPRGIQIKLAPSELPAGARPSTLPGERISPGQGSTGWGFAGTGSNLTGVRIGPIRADNEGFRIGRNGMVADSKGFRIGQNGLVADSNGFRIGNMLVADNDGFRLGGFSATSRGVRLGGWGIGQRETPADANLGSSRDIPESKMGGFGQRDVPDEKRKDRGLRDHGRHHHGPHHLHHHMHDRGRARVASHFAGHGVGHHGIDHGVGRGIDHVCGRGRGQSHHRNDRRGRRSSSTSSRSSSSSSSSSSSDSSAGFEAKHKGFVGLKKELKELKRAHKQAKRQAKKERHAAKRAAKKERRREKREGKRAMREARGGHDNCACGDRQHPEPFRQPHNSDGLVTGVVGGADPGYQVPGAFPPPPGPPPNARTVSAPRQAGGPTLASQEANDLRLQARDLEHEALVKETVANGIRAAATSTDLPEKKRVKKLEEASVVYEEAEALRREVERLRAEASDLELEFGNRNTVEFGKAQAHFMG